MLKESEFQYYEAYIWDISRVIFHCLHDELITVPCFEQWIKSRQSLPSLDQLHQAAERTLSSSSSAPPFLGIKPIVVRVQKTSSSSTSAVPVSTIATTAITARTHLYPQSEVKQPAEKRKDPPPNGMDTPDPKRHQPRTSSSLVEGVRSTVKEDAIRFIKSQALCYGRDVLSVSMPKLKKRCPGLPEAELIEIRRTLTHEFMDYIVKTPPLLAEFQRVGDSKIKAEWDKAINAKTTEDVFKVCESWHTVNNEFTYYNQCLFGEALCHGHDLSSFPLEWIERFPANKIDWIKRCLVMGRISRLCPNFRWLDHTVVTWTSLKSYLLLTNGHHLEQHFLDFQRNEPDRCAQIWIPVAVAPMKD
jgi:hypothetical protein